MGLCFWRGRGRVDFRGVGGGDGKSCAVKEDGSPKSSDGYAVSLFPEKTENI